MTGPEHYVAAERLLDQAKNDKAADPDLLVEMARVHAQLADVAVRVSRSESGLLGYDQQAWRTVATEAFSKGWCPVCSRHGDQPCVMADHQSGEELQRWHRARRRGYELRGEPLPASAGGQNGNG